MKQNLLTHIMRLTILFLLFFGGGTGSAVAGPGLECRGTTPTKPTALAADLADPAVGPALLDFLSGNTAGITAAARVNRLKAWEFAFDCPSTIRTNTTILEGLFTAIQRGAKNLDDIVAHANHPAITNKTVKHIFRGDSGGGRHHIAAILNDNTRKLVNRLEETSEGFYGAVFSSGGRKSFWPDSWDEFRVMDELKYVMNNSPNNVAGNRWQATTQGGQLIEYYLHADGHIISAFPVLPNFP